jgi:hypothetical protein
MRDVESRIPCSPVIYKRKRAKPYSAANYLHEKCIPEKSYNGELDYDR